MSIKAPGPWRAVADGVQDDWLSSILRPLTGADWVQEVDPSLPTHFLDVPWLLIGSLVLALPLLTAAIVGVTTRSRLPLVARID